VHGPEPGIGCGLIKPGYWRIAPEPGKLPVGDTAYPQVQVGEVDGDRHEDSLAPNEINGNEGQPHMRVIVIRHHAEDSPGFIAQAFQERGADLSTFLFPDGGPLPAFDGADHIVVLGAIPSVNDEAPWMEQEITWLRQANAAGLPILGICFGAQAMCAAFGGAVERAPALEVGWRLVETADEELIPPGPWLEFHGDRCLPPQEARILATNEAGVQAFSIGRHLAVQFHPEVDGAQLKLWLDAGGRPDVVQAGEDPEEFLAQTITEEPAAKARADVLVATAIRLASAAHKFADLS
jgi:GMP synthase-like glutamine amidotransferase